MKTAAKLVTVLFATAAIIAAGSGIGHASTPAATVVHNHPAIHTKVVNPTTSAATATITVDGDDEAEVGIAVYSCKGSCSDLSTQTWLASYDGEIGAGQHQIHVEFSACGPVQVDTFTGEVIYHLSTTNEYGARRLSSLLTAAQTSCSPTSTPTPTSSKPIGSTSPVAVKTTKLAPVVKFSKSKPASPTLPYTGSNTGPQVRWAIGLILAGGMLVIASMRRTRRIRGQHS